MAEPKHLVLIWCSLALAFQLRINQAQQAVPETYPVNWNSVPSSSSAKDLTANCICNVVEFVCDPSCCCDPACPPSVVNATRIAGACLPEGPPDETLDYCVPSSWVQKVNLPSSSDFYSTTIQAADNKFFDQLLCIVTSANPNLGPQYADPSPSDPNNANLAGCSTPLPWVGLRSAVPPARPPGYLRGTPIMVKAVNKADAPSWPLTLPYPALSSQCSDEYQIGFLNLIPVAQQNVFSECTRPTQDLSPGGIIMSQTTCTPSSPLSATRYTSLFYMQDPTTTGLGATLTKTWQYLDPEDGSITPLTTTTDIAPSYSGDTCYNALRFINMTFVYTPAADGYMLLSQVQMSLTLTDLTRFDPTFSQSLRVDFLPFQSSDERVVTLLSGNPGYLTGFPLLTGTVANQDPLQGTKKAIQRLAFGTPLPAGNQDGECSPTSGAQVRFGYNATSTCAITLSGSELASWCDNKGSAAQSYLAGLLDGVWEQLTSNNVYVGIWGNSNWTQTSEWIQVVQSNTDFSGMLYSRTSRECGNVVVGYDIKVLYGVAFAANNLQKKVLYVNICYRKGTWAFPLDKDLSAQHRFYMTSSVSFIPLPQKPYNDIKPAPPLVVPLPEDIFYPFVTSGAQMPAPCGGLLLLLLLTGVLAALAAQVMAA